MNHTPLPATFPGNFAEYGVLTVHAVVGEDGTVTVRVPDLGVSGWSFNARNVDEAIRTLSVAWRSAVQQEPASDAGQPSHLVRVLADVRRGRFGIGDSVGGPVWIEADGQGRPTAAAPVIDALLRQGHLQRADTVICLLDEDEHTVSHLAVTPAGEQLYQRLSRVLAGRTRNHDARWHS
jgi:hypothetical protein